MMNDEEKDMMSFMFRKEDIFCCDCCTFYAFDEIQEMKCPEGHYIGG